MENGDARSAKVSRKRPLRKHQYPAFRYTMEQKHPALFMQMRLGKCLVTIRRILLYKPLDPVYGLRVLIVAPSSAIEGWLDELKEEGQTEVVTLCGPRANRVEALRNWKACWYIANKETHRILPELASVNFDAVVLDESNYLCNLRTDISKFFIYRFRHVAHRWALTGIPAPESDLQFWGHIAWLDGSAFGYNNFWDYRACECRVDPYGYKWYPTKEAHATIREEVAKRCFTQRRNEVGLEPEKTYVRRMLEFPSSARKQYTETERNFSIADKTTIWATEKYIWLRKMCSGLIGDRLTWQGKLKELLYLLENELKGEPVVVFFFFNDELHSAQKFLSQNKIKSRSVWGELKREEREIIRKEWMAGKFPVLLMQQAVAQTGMDLSAANTAIFYSEPPGQLASAQVEDRIVNIGNPRPLSYIYLLVKDTVDEDLHIAGRAKSLHTDLSFNAILKERLEQRARPNKAKRLPR